MADTDDTCGYLEDDDKLPNGVSATACNKQVWKNHRRCFWHSEVENKPIEEIEARWERIPKRIDGIHLSKVVLGSKIDFSEKTLYAGNFEGADLTEANFRDAELDFSNFRKAILRSTNFNTSNTSVRSCCFDSSECMDTRFQRSELHNSTFDSANMNSVKLWQTQATGVIFTNARLYDSKLACANLRNAILDNAKLDESDCRSAVFEGASLRGAELRGASLIDADLFDVSIQDAKVDHKTEFGAQTRREFLFDRKGEYLSFYMSSENSEESSRERGAVDCRKIDDFSPIVPTRVEYSSMFLYRYKFLSAIDRLIGRNPITNKASDSELKTLSETMNIYRDIRQLFRENPVPEQRRWYNIREKEVRRKMSYTRLDWSWLRWSSLRWSMLYGESAKQVIVAAIGVILISTILYPIWGLQSSSDAIIRYSLSGNISLNHSLSLLSYSIRRLFGPVDGSVTAIGPSEWIALAETVAGALLTAMLVFTLGRRATS